MKLIEILKMNKKTLIEKICSSADQKGRHSWLWMPKANCTNKKVCIVAHVDTVFDENGDGHRGLFSSLDNNLRDMVGGNIGLFNKIKINKDIFTVGSGNKGHNNGSGRNNHHSKKVYFDPVAQVYWSPTGLGADDRAGIYACSKIRRETKCMVLFTDFEETRGVGAYEALRKFTKHFEDISFFLEIDRKGNKEMVFYNGESQQFKDFISTFGFHEQRGSFSDVAVLGQGTGKPAVNVSAGYWHAHTRHEYLKVKHLNNTITRVLNIIQKGDESYAEKEHEWRVCLNEGPLVKLAKCPICGKIKPVPGFDAYGYRGSMEAPEDFMACAECCSEEHDTIGIYCI
jgi:hypothetical protein